jgi:hypothetical protein
VSLSRANAARRRSIGALTDARSIALAFVLGSLATAAHADAYRDELRIDGVVVRLARRHVPAVPQDALAAETATWRRESPADPVVRSNAGTSAIIGQRRLGTYRTAQFSATPGGTWVTVSTRELHARPRDPVLPFALPAGVEVVRTVETVREQPSALQVVARARSSVARVRERLQVAAEREGWRAETTTDAAAAGSVLAWRRGADEMLAIVDGHGRASTVLLHVVRRTVSEPQ